MGLESAVIRYRRSLEANKGPAHTPGRIGDTGSGTVLGNKRPSERGLLQRGNVQRGSDPGQLAIPHTGQQELWDHAFQEAMDRGKSVAEGELMADDAVAKATFRERSTSGKLLDPHLERRRSMILDQYNLSEQEILQTRSHTVTD
jgi:hypothetical protein